MNHSWRGFDMPIRLYLYGRILDLRNIKTEYRSVHGIDSRGKHQRLHKNDILFAFPFENVPDVKPHIKKGKHLRVARKCNQRLMKEN